MKFIALMFCALNLPWLAQAQTQTEIIPPQATAALVQTLAPAPARVPGQAVVSVSASTQVAESAEFTIGIGYQICGDRTQAPPLDDAYYCPGLLPLLKKVKVEMQPQKSASPKIQFWSGNYSESVSFRSYEMTVEVLVAMSETNGQRTVYIDGRIGDNTSAKKTYFRLAADGGFDRLSYTTLYGIPISFQYNGDTLELAPHVIITR